MPAMPFRIDKIIALGLKIISVDPNIHIIQGLMRSRSPFGNVVLILDKKTALIDTGCGLELIEKILPVVKIDLVINSHSHPDHTAGNWRIIKQCKPAVMIPEYSQETIGNAKRLAVRMVGETLAPLWIENHLPVTGYQDFAHTGVYGEGHVFDFGRVQLIALHTPGHTNDHFSFYDPDRKVIFGSDIDLSPFGPWYGNRESSIPRFKSSIMRLSMLNSKVYVSSHAKPLTGHYIAKRLDAYAAVFDKRTQTIRELIAASGQLSLDDLVLKSPIYECDHAVSDKILHYGETRMVEKHVEELISAGLVARTENGLLQAL